MTPPRPPAQASAFPRPLATAYLTVVTLCWLGHLLAVVLLLTGLLSFTEPNALITGTPWVVLAAILIAGAATIVVLLTAHRLDSDRAPFNPIRLLGLVYGSAVPTVWRQLRA